MEMEGKARRPTQAARLRIKKNGFSKGNEVTATKIGLLTFQVIQFDFLYNQSWATTIVVNFCQSSKVLQIGKTKSKLHNLQMRC